MKFFAYRLRRNFGLLVVAAGLVLFVHAVLSVSLLPESRYSGWLLALLMIVLAGYNVFKKIPFVPLGTSSTWLQFHIYLGLLTVVVFVLHAGVGLPHGLLGWILEVQFIGVAGSGLAGLAMSRSFPAQLRARGEEVIFERIPAHRRHLQKKVEHLVLHVAAEAHSTLIADFYLHRLQKFFDRPRNFWRHV